MKELLLLLAHLFTLLAKLIGPGGARAAIAENLVLKQQLMIISRSRQRAPNLSPRDRFVLGLGTFFFQRSRIAKVSVIIQPSTLLKFHKYLVRRNYRLLYSPLTRKKPGPKGPSADLERKLGEFQQYYNDHRVHASLNGNTPAETSGHIVHMQAKLQDFRWETYCRDLVQLPLAA